VSHAWDEVASSQRYVRSLIESVPRRMTSVVEDHVKKMSGLQNSPFRS
jgi:hypothetical protein